MIHKNISYGFNFDTKTNILAADSSIKDYGFFSTFTLMLVAIISTYKLYDILPDIDGSNLLNNLQQDSTKDMYRCFFETDYSVDISIEKSQLEKVTNPDMHHTIYNQENLTYLLPFFKRYFKLNANIESKIDQLINKYDVIPNNSISVIIRGSDKWTDFGGMITSGPGTYVRMVEKIVQQNPNIKVLLQTEHDDIIRFCRYKFLTTFFDETKTTTNASVPIFLTDIENKLDWAEWYVAALWIHAQSKYVITYSGNSAFFIYLARGSTKNLYQEISFKKSCEEFFVNDVKTDFVMVDLKMSVGEIIDRYSICLLKKERLQIDISDELDVLRKEIDKLPNNLKTYVGQLKEINGNIWDLESDIRQGKENLLGLKEVGRRAIEIRNWNNKRVSLKNEITSRLENGFLEIKANHASEKLPSVVITLSTVPARLNLDDDNGLKLVLRELCEQRDDDYEVHFNIPHTYNITKEEYIIPDWLSKYKIKYPHLRIFRTDDVGPPTKVLPTLKRVNPETIVLVVDDDLVYHRDMVKEHRRWQNEYPNSAIVYEGRGSDPYYYDIRDSWVLCVTRVTKTHGLQHYKSASYKAKLFTDDFWNHYVGKTLSDDVLIGRYFRDTDIPMYSVPYEPEIHLYETKELWDSNNGVTTFPVVTRAVSVEDTGCNDKILLSQQPKFYEPTNLGNFTKNKTDKISDTIPNNAINFDTDKITHGYIPLYRKTFELIPNCEKVLEIGVAQGASLRLLSSFFPKAHIHGVDLTPMPELCTDKITVHVGNQENREDLEKIISKTDENLFDVILDDGGHTMRQQQISLGCLFKHIKSGGYYILEDLHTSRMEQFFDPNCIKTSLDMLLEFQSTKKIVSNYMTAEEIEYLEKTIESVVIWSRTDDMKQSVTSIIKKIG